VTPEERERMIFLCNHITEEENPEKFNELVLCPSDNESMFRPSNWV